MALEPGLTMAVKTLCLLLSSSSTPSTWPDPSRTGSASAVFVLYLQHHHNQATSETP